MPNKDTSQKALLHLPDVFASLVNLLLFDNTYIIHPEQVRFLNISSHFQYDSDLHPLYHDVCALILDQDQDPSFIFCIENQTKPHSKMPIRMLNYTASAFAWQLTHFKDKRFLVPCVGFVLYYGRSFWNAPSFDDLIQIEKHPFLKPWVSSYKMNLENIAWWSREKIEGIQSDFRFIADYCDQMRRTKGKRYDPPKDWKIDHVEETLITLAAFSKDRNLEEAFDQYLEDFRLLEPKGETTMKSVIDHIEQRGFLRAKKIIKSQSEELEAKDQALEEKDKEIKVQSQQIGNMISTFVALAQNLMTEQHLTALQACDALGYSEDIRDLVLPHLMN